MKEVVDKTLSAFRPSVEARAEEWLGKKLTPDIDSRCWHLVGYDFTFDSELKPVFFEANAQTRQTIVNVKKKPDGTEYYLESEFYPKVFPPMLTEKYRMMLGSDETGRWKQVYDSDNHQEDLNEKTFRIFKSLFPEDQHMTRLTQEQFSAVKDKLQGAQDMSDETLNEIFAKSTSDNNMDLQDFYEAVEHIGDNLGKHPSEVV